MTTLDAQPSNPTPPLTPAPARAVNKKSALARWFHPAVSVILIVLAFWGFHHFYMQGRSYPGRPITPPIRGLVIAHGVAMAGWLVLFFVQTMLIGVKKHKLHMKLGLAAVGFTAIVFLLGLFIAVYSARTTPANFVLWTLLPKQFLAVPMISIWIFAGFVVAGVKYKKKPAIHRAMMVGATFALMSAGISRIDLLSNTYLGTPLEGVFGPFLWTIVLMGLLLAVRCVIVKGFDRPFALAFAIVAASGPLIMVIGRTGAWESFASLLVP